MMSDQAEIDAALDKLEITNDPAPGEELAVVDTHIEPVPGEPKAEDKENPPGYIDNLDDWVAAGKDPDDFKGKNAYKAEHARITEIRELKGLVKDVQETTTDWRASQQAQMEAQYKRDLDTATAELNKAKDESDIDAALAAKDKISNLSRPEVTRPTAAPEENPIIADFRKANPILDSSNPLYDQAFNATVTKAQRSALNRLTGGDETVVITPEELKGSLRKALEVAKEIYPDKFRSPRNDRGGGTPKPKPKATKGGDYGSRLKQLKSSSLNSRDVSPEYDTYQLLKAKDEKRAETYAKTMLGE